MHFIALLGLAVEKLQMIAGLPDAARRRRNRHIPANEQRPAIGMPEWPKPSQIAHQPCVDLTEIGDAIDLQFRHEQRRFDHRGRVSAKGLTEIGEARRLHFQSRGHFVPAVAFQKFAARVQRMCQMKPRDRSAASLAVSIVQADHDGGPVVSIDDP